MLFNVPQYIDVEDKIAGPLTARQLGWMFGMGIILVILYKTLETEYFYMSAVPVAIIFVALAFYRPYNQSLIKFIFFTVWFFFRPKIYVWNREAKENNQPPAKKEVTPKEENRIFSENEAQAFAQLLDTRGEKKDDKILEYIKKHQALRK